MSDSVQLRDLRSEGVGSDTWKVIVGPGALERVAECFAGCFGGELVAGVVADGNTWSAAGSAVAARVGRGRAVVDPLIFPAAPVLHADMPNVDRVTAWLSKTDAIPVVVGAGTLNDLVKLAAHRCGRPYMCVGTAASMDGYVAFGASITQEGSKQTFDCPAPRAFVGDIDVIAKAPPGMSATGYADLLAKIPAGADWILADALGIEPINPRAWQLVQSPLRSWLSDPVGVSRAEPRAIEHLLNGLLAGGLAMQVTKNSRPASGAEHQFSHLWDMEGHQHNGQPVPHGSKVAIGTLASCSLYEAVLKLPLDKLDVDACVARWQPITDVKQGVQQLFTPSPLREKALLESTAKHVSIDVFRARLETLRAVWPTLRKRIREQLLSASELRRMLSQAGAPNEPQDIGISRARLYSSFLRARMIRRRYTILDLAWDIGRLLEWASTGAI